ncbi:hypothetical protein EMCG_08655 [[Emmonsia] crescens]|uniref:Uncharacterized protein n=1 Tax=[Emmonsia] crescens TaxID=73230 RepID=A0A0G2JAD0_9EURO|nr:hypothetical protein EMCG_08655 [Emmonsia crescens UAMH 3008]
MELGVVKSLTTDLENARREAERCGKHQLDLDFFRETSVKTHLIAFLTALPAEIKAALKTPRRPKPEPQTESKITHSPDIKPSTRGNRAWNLSIPRLTIVLKIIKVIAEKLGTRAARGDKYRSLAGDVGGLGIGEEASRISADNVVKFVIDHAVGKVTEQMAEWDAPPSNTIPSMPQYHVWQQAPADDMELNERAEFYHQPGWGMPPTDSTLNNVDPFTQYQGISNSNQVYHPQPPADNQRRQLHSISNICMTPFARLEEFPDHEQAYVSTPDGEAVLFARFQGFPDHNQTYHQLPLVGYAPNDHIIHTSQLPLSVSNYVSNCQNAAQNSVLFAQSNGSQIQDGCSLDPPYSTSASLPAQYMLQLVAGIQQLKHY